MKITKIILLSFILLSANSCSILKPIQVVSPFNAELVKDINAIGIQFDAFSQRIEESKDKVYDTYAPDYGGMEVLSNSIVARLEAMPKSGAMLKQAQLVQTMLLNYKDRHKARIKLNDSEIRINRIYFRDQLKPLFVSAMALK